MALGGEGGCGGPPPGFSQLAAWLLLGGAGEIQIVPQVSAWRSPHHQREFAGAASPSYHRPGKFSNRNLSSHGWEFKVKAIPSEAAGENRFQVCPQLVISRDRWRSSACGYLTLSSAFAFPRPLPCVQSVYLSTRIGTHPSPA